MKIRTGRLILLVLISFSLVCNDLLASSFLARPGYGVTTGREFDQLNPDGTPKKKKKPTVVAPPPVVETPGKDASAAPRRRVVVVQPPVETPVSASATRQISSSSKPAATPLRTGPKKGVPVPAPIIIELPPVKTAAIKPTGPAPQIVAAPAIISPPAPKEAKPAGPSVPPPRQTRPPGTVDPPEQLAVVAKKPQAPSQKATGPVVVSAPLPVKTVEPLAVPVTPSASGAQIARQPAKAVVPARPAPVSAPAPIAKPDLEPMARPQKAGRPATGKAPAVIQAPAEIPASHYPAQDTRVTIHEKRPGRSGRKPEGTVNIAEGNQPLPKPVVTAPAAAPRPVSVIPPTPETSAKPAPARETGKAALAPDSQNRAIRPVEAVAPAQAPAKSITAPEPPSAATTVADASKTAPVESSASSRAAKETTAADKPSGSSETLIAGEDSVDESIDDNSMGMEVTTTASGAGSAIYGVSSFDSGLRVEATTDLQSITVEPGRSFTLSFRTTNISGKPGNFIEEFDMPPGFELTFPPAEFSLEPMESYNSIVMVSAPAYLPAGEHQFAYRVFDPKNQSVHGSLSFRFSINATVDLKFIVEEQPNSVLDGENFTIKGKLYNNSNVDYDISMAMTQPQQYNVSVTPEKALLEAGKFTDVVIEGRNTSRRRADRVITTSLEVRNAAKRSDNILLRQNISFRFFSRSSSRVDFRHKLPGTFRTQIAGDKNDYSVQMELSGRGMLDNKGQRRIEYQVRQNYSPTRGDYYARRDVASVNYTGKFGGIRVGDHSFGVSSLSRYHYGKGLGVDMRINRQTMAGVINYKRNWTSIPLHGTGFYLSQKVTDSASLRFNHLVTTGDNNPRSPDEKISSLVFSYNSSYGTILNAELAHKWGGDIYNGKNAAYSVDFSRNFRNKGSVSISHQDHGAVYAGSAMGSENTNASVNYRLSGNSNVNILHTTSKQKPVEVMTGMAAAETSNFQAGFDYKNASAMRFSLEFFESTANDWISDNYNEREQGVKARVSRAWGKISTSYSLNRRRWLDNLTGQDNWSTAHGLSATLRQTKNLVMSLSAGIRNRGNKNSVFDSGIKNYGITTDWAILENLRLRFNYSEIIYDRDKAGYQTMDMALSYRLTDTSLDFRVRNHQNSSSSIDRPLYYEFSMSQRFGVAVGTSDTFGALTGLVKEKIGSDTVPLANFPLIMGNFVAVTDSSGRFVFADLHPGSYTIDVDNRFGDNKKLSQPSLPLLVGVKGGKLGVLDITFEESAIFEGLITLADTRIPGDSVSIEKLHSGNIQAPMPKGFRELHANTIGGVLLEIFNENNRYNVRSNSDGRLILNRIKPGKYNYRIIGASLPGGYSIDNREGTVELTTDDRQLVQFKLSPVIRTIELVGVD